ncbi:LysR family transcriptional regulator [Microbacterium sp. SS28]|uniref:LysR family transcriptional regulator n=1 Tax=Microbacterium sp. SS28 TaxID=2919948 RepID=UPI001FAA7AEF|nr:LysR family transcriptional regulator [Microbacterium sp. SS28]
MSDLGLWRAFLAVHATGTLSAAARTMGITQPAVSAQLQNLERLLGERLFERTARGVVPTARAAELAARLAGPFDAVAAALTGVGPDASSFESPVRVGGPAELLAEVVAPLLAPLVADGVRVHLVPGLPGPLVELLRTGGLDLVIASERPRGRAVVGGPLVDETFVLVASPGFAEQHGLAASTSPPAGAEAFAGLPLLAYAHDVPILRRFWRHVFGVRLERDPALTLPDLRALRDAAVAGAGVTVLPSYLCRAALDGGALLDVHPTDDPPINTLHLVRRPGSATRSHVERVRGILTDPVVATVADDGPRLSPVSAPAATLGA